MSTLDGLEEYIAEQPGIPGKLPPAAVTGQHILEFRAENIKRLTVVNIDCQPTGNVIISGDNGAGKSSVLDAIQMALCGTRSVPGKPIREGKDRAFVVLRTEDMVVTRRFSGDNSYLEVTSPDGRKYASPQGMLDALVSKVAIDPLAFSELDPKEQASMLLKLFPTELDLKANAEEQKAITVQRRDVNRDLDTVRAQYAAYKDVPATVPPEVDVSALSSEVEVLQGKRSERERVEYQLSVEKDAVEKMRQKIERLKVELVALEMEVLGSEVYLQKDTTDYAAQIAEKSAEIKAASGRNQLARRAAKRDDMLEHGKELAKSSEILTNKINALVDARLEALRTASFPVPGLSVDDDGSLTLNGIPLAQSCSSEQIKVGVALAAAGNPGLRVAFIKHGSLLDEKSLATVADIAGQYGMQIWIERVAGDVGVHIVDGSNVAATDATGDVGCGGEAF